VHPLPPAPSPACRGRGDKRGGGTLFPELRPGLNYSAPYGAGKAAENAAELICTTYIADHWDRTLAPNPKPPDLAPNPMGLAPSTTELPVSNFHFRVSAPQRAPIFEFPFSSFGSSKGPIFEFPFSSFGSSKGPIFEFPFSSFGSFSWLPAPDTLHLDPDIGDPDI